MVFVIIYNLYINYLEILIVDLIKGKFGIYVFKYVLLILIKFLLIELFIFIIMLVIEFGYVNLKLFYYF